MYVVGECSSQQCVWGVQVIDLVDSGCFCDVDVLLVIIFVVIDEVFQCECMCCICLDFVFDENVVKDVVWCGIFDLIDEEFVCWD